MGTNQALRILHCGDIYLGRPFAELSAKSSERRRSETKQTFKNLLHYVEEQQIQLVLISGNLFDFDYVSYDTVSWVMREMEKMTFARFMIAPGTADTVDKEDFYSVCHVPANVHIFSAKPECVCVPELNVSVYGWGITAVQEDARPMARVPAIDENSTLLICGCVNRAGQGGVQVTPDEIASCGALFVGLSDGEGFLGFKQMGDSVVAMSGVLESGSFSDTGFGGANLLCFLREGEALLPAESASDAPTDLPPAEQLNLFEVEEGKKEESTQTEEKNQKPQTVFSVFGGSIAAERLLFGGRRYVTETIDISCHTKDDEVEEALCRLVREKGYGAETSLHLVLRGHTTPDFAPPHFRDHTAYGLAELVSEDKTVPDRDEQDYLRDMSIRGELMRAMMPSILNGEEKSKENAIKALRIAFSALDNEDSYHI